MKASLFLTAALLAITATPMANAETDCEPYPIGRCGSYDRENVIFCYKLVGGVMVDASTEAETIAVEDKEILHVRTAPTTALAADVMNAPLPFQSTYREANSVAGLQIQTVICATFEWWAECDSWMGPYNEFLAEPDEQIV